MLQTKSWTVYGESSAAIQDDYNIAALYSTDDLVLLGVVQTIIEARSARLFEYK